MATWEWVWVSRLIEPLAESRVGWEAGFGWVWVAGWPRGGRWQGGGVRVGVLVRRGEGKWDWWVVGGWAWGCGEWLGRRGWVGG